MSSLIFGNIISGFLLFRDEFLSSDTAWPSKHFHFQRSSFGGDMLYEIVQCCIVIVVVIMIEVGIIVDVVISAIYGGGKLFDFDISWMPRPQMIKMMAT